MSTTQTQRALDDADAALAGSTRQPVIEAWSRLVGLLDLEARGDAAHAVQATVLRLQAWLDEHPSC